jgi:hypothetical protein
MLFFWRFVCPLTNRREEPFYCTTISEHTKENCDTILRSRDPVSYTPSHPTRSAITIFRTVFRVTILAVGCILCAKSILLAAELFPFTPPPRSQQRSVEQQPVRPSLTSEELDRISKIATQARQLSPSDQNQLKNSTRKSLDEALGKGNLNQAKYFSELLRQID